MFEKSEYLRGLHLYIPIVIRMVIRRQIVPASEYLPCVYSAMVN